jgi:hypothetical protein
MAATIDEDVRSDKTLVHYHRICPSYDIKFSKGIRHNEASTPSACHTLNHLQKQTKRYHVRSVLDNDQT